jgi:hypothetical protein
MNAPLHPGNAGFEPIARNEAVLQADCDAPTFKGAAMQLN